MKGYIKVPFRHVYCQGFKQWAISVWECHVLLRIKKHNFPKIV